MASQDQRYTCLAGKRVKKSAAVLELLGDLDELNCLLGLAKVFSSDKKLIDRLDKLQEDIFLMSGEVSGAKVEFDFEVKKRQLEKEIEKRRDPELKTFVKPGKDKFSAFLHLARAVCRRAERKAVRLVGEGKLVAYLNRLSGLLFWLAEGEGKK